MEEEIRLRLYKELKEELERKYRAITKVVEPKNGETIKLQGKVLYKIIRLPNKWGNRGVVVHNFFDDSLLASLGGERAKGKKNWAGLPLTNPNYDSVKKTLLDIASTVNLIRSDKMMRATRRSKSSRKKPSASFTSLVYDLPIGFSKLSKDALDSDLEKFKDSLHGTDSNPPPKLIKIKEGTTKAKKMSKKI